MKRPLPRSPRLALAFLLRLSPLVPGAGQHGQARVLGEAGIHLGARAAPEDMALPPGAERHLSPRGPHDSRGGLQTVGGELAVPVLEQVPASTQRRGREPTAVPSCPRICLSPDHSPTMPDVRWQAVAPHLEGHRVVIQGVDIVDMRGREQPPVTGSTVEREIPGRPIVSCSILRSVEAEVTIVPHWMPEARLSSRRRSRKAS